MRALIAAAFLAGASVAVAAPPEGVTLDLALSSWFRSMHNRDGMSRCSESDGHFLADDAWRWVGGHYEILIGNNWISVPDRSIAVGPMNPTGRGVAWYTAANLYCFSAPPLA